MSRRQLLLGACTALVGAPWAHAQSQEDPIKLAAILPFSGGLELFGQQAKLGIEVAVAELNRGGGVFGRNIEVSYLDDKTDPKTAVERAQQAIERHKVLAIVGPITSSNRDAMLPTIRRGKTPLLYATNYEGGTCDRYMFAFNTVPNQELERLLPELKQRAGNTFYLLGADYVWPQKMFEQAQALITAQGGKVLGKELLPFGTKEFTPTIRRIQASGAKVLLKALPGADGITFIKQAEDFGLLKTLTVGFLGFAETYLGAFGVGKGQNMWVTVPFAAALPDPLVQEFVQRVRNLAGTDAPISHYVWSHYNAIMALAQALRRAGRIDREALVQALEGLSLATPTGNITINASDHHLTMPMYLARTEGTGLTVVKPLGMIAPQAHCGRPS